MYEGRTKAESGIVFGHENMCVPNQGFLLFIVRIVFIRIRGIVEEVGEAVSFLKRGDRVVMPFNVACGRCQNCEQKKTA